VASFPAAPPSSGPNLKALLWILVGTLLFLGTGIGLVIYCLSGGLTPEAEPRPPAEGNSPPKAEAPRPKNPPVPVNRQAKKNPPRDDRQAEEKPRAVLPNAEQDKVNKAIDRGVAFLKSTQQADGGWATPEGDLAYFKVGFAALPGLTLLECGVPANDPAVQKVAQFLREQETSVWGNKIELTYDLSLAILFLDRLGEAKDTELIQKLALRLVAGQKASGGWTYQCPILTEAEHKQLSSALKTHGELSASPLDLKRLDPNKLTVAGGNPLPSKLKRLAVWRDDTDPTPKDPKYPQKESDNSNTQFAILGLWAAKRHDLPLDRTLALIAKRFRKSQNEDGSWGYLASGQGMVEGVKHPTMTCAGLLGLAVGLGLANEAKAKLGVGEARTPAGQNPAVKKGLERVAHDVGDPHQPWKNVPQIDLYFVWSVERVAVIYNLSRLGGKDWYGWGAEMLVANQTDKGNWQNGKYPHSTPTIDTCFALLFLKRANLAKDLTAKLQLGD
jgi:hypothetical protein